MAASVPYLDKSGALKERSVDPEAFRRRGRKVLLKEVVIMTEARRRAGTHAARTRGEVQGSTKKMYRQKHTGNARHGAPKPHIFRGGGMCHAKKPRDYGWAVPRKARRAALEAAIRAKLDDGEIRIVERFGIDAPKTKDFLDLVRRLDLDGTMLVVPAQHSDALWRSCRNVEGAAYKVAADLNAYEILRRKWVLLDDAAYRSLEERFAKGESA